MDAAAENYEVDREYTQEKSCAPRGDAPFTEIYELILYNQSLVKSELGVLQDLIQKKLIQEAGTTPGAPMAMRVGS